MSFIQNLKKGLKRQFLLLLSGRRFVFKVNRPQEKCLYLTFDDGPVPGVSEPLLDLLREHDAKATFFVIGKRLENHFEIGQRAVEEGHAVGNHSYSHQGFGQLPLAQQADQVLQANQAIERLQKGYRGFRAPQGRWSLNLAWWLLRRGFAMIHWSYDSMDYSNLPADQIIRTFKEQPVGPGEVILFHDDSPLCIEVLAELIPYWREQGYQFKTLENLS